MTLPKETEARFDKEFMADGTMEVSAYEEGYPYKFLKHEMNDDGQRLKSFLAEEIERAVGAEIEKTIDRVRHSLGQLRQWLNERPGVDSMVTDQQLGIWFSELLNSETKLSTPPKSK